MPWLFKYQNSNVWSAGCRLPGQQFQRSIGQRQRTDAEKLHASNNEAEIEYTCPLSTSGGGNREGLSIGKNGVADGIRTRNNKLHKLGLYH
jgi:hypothetical protein